MREGDVSGRAGPDASCASRSACDVCPLPRHSPPVLLPPPALGEAPGCVPAALSSPGLWLGMGCGWGRASAHWGSLGTAHGGRGWIAAASSPPGWAEPQAPRVSVGSQGACGDPLSGWCGLSPGKSEGNGKMHITLCDLVSTWDSLSPTQKKSLNQRYQMGCECKVSTGCTPLPTPRGGSAAPRQARAPR